MTMDPKNSNLCRLSWDSIFFETPVFKISSSKYSEIQELVLQISNPSFTYIFSASEIKELAHSLMDKKVLLEVSTAEILDSKTSPECFVFDGQNMPTTELESLALVSSTHSRFRQDPLIPKEKTDKLYKIWIQNAISDLKDHRIIAISIQDEIAGMISLKVEPHLIKIELVAVHPNHQRKGIASKLINSALQYGKKQGAPQIQVTTQLDNAGAFALYERCGFKTKEINYIYHLHK